MGRRTKTDPVWCAPSLFVQGARGSISSGEDWNGLGKEEQSRHMGFSWKEGALLKVRRLQTEDEVCLTGELLGGNRRLQAPKRSKS